MTTTSDTGLGSPAMARTVALYPWIKLGHGLMFWQATWFLYFQSELSAAQAILLYAVYDVATTVIEVPSGYLSDRVGRRITLVLSAATGALGALTLGLGEGFLIFALGQALLGSASALASGTDSAILYEALAADGRQDEVEAQEVRAWRFNFTGFALSAVTGGAMALWWDRLPFLASAAALLAVTILSLRLVEPPKHTAVTAQGGEWIRLGQLRGAFRKPVLVWLFALSVLMYGYSHLPFVFGQPFIQEALGGLGLAAEAPVVSGAVTTMMMLVSVAVSLIAPRLRESLGLARLLLLAFAIQIFVAAALAASNAAIIIFVLFLRMVPSSLSTPFILARLQPALENDSRATFLSLKSLAGRLLFAGSLWLAAGGASQTDEMAFAEIRGILVWYVLAGLIAIGTLAIASRRIRLER